MPAILCRLANFKIYNKNTISLSLPQLHLPFTSKKSKDNTESIFLEQQHKKPTETIIDILEHKEEINKVDPNIIK